MLDGFEDDYVFEDIREPRPLLKSIMELQTAIVTAGASGFDSLPFSLPPSIVEETLSSRSHDVDYVNGWEFLSHSAIIDTDRFLKGDYMQILGAELASNVIFKPISEDEELLFSPRFSDLNSLTMFLRSRIYDYVSADTMDEFADKEGSIDTPMYFRIYRISILGAALLNLFLQVNFTGPELTAEGEKQFSSLSLLSNIKSGLDPKLFMTSSAEYDLFRPHSAPQLVESEPNDLPDIEPISERARAALSALRAESNEPYELLEKPDLLVLARALFSALLPLSTSSSSLTGLESESTPSEEEMERAAEDNFRVKKLRKYTVGRGASGAHWLAARTVQAHARSLLDRVPVVSLLRSTLFHFQAASAMLENHERMSAIFTDLDQFDYSLAQSLSWDSSDASGENSDATRITPESLGARLALEWGLAQHFFDRVRSAKTSFAVAKAISGLRALVTGAMGRRTKFQQWDIAQLVVRTRSRESVVQAANEAGVVVGTLTTHAVGGSTDEDGMPRLQDVSEEGAPIVEVPKRNTELDGISLSYVEPLPTVAGVKEVQLAEIDAQTHLLERVQLSTESSKRDARKREITAFPEGFLGEIHNMNRAIPVGTTISESIEDHVCADSADGEGVATLRESEGEMVEEGLNILASDRLRAADDGYTSPLDQCILLAMCLDIQNHSPADGLTGEQMRPFLERVVLAPQTWLVHSVALLSRAHLEFEGHRTAERAALQIQALVDQHSTKLTQMQRSAEVAAGAPVTERLAYLCSLAWPARWDLARTCADKYNRLGAVRAALELFERLQLWEDAVSCYITLDRVRAAERLVRRQLGRAITPRLLCLLGSVTDLDGPYEEALRITQGKYPKAELAMGRRAATKGGLEKAIGLLLGGLQRAPGSADDWFLLGTLGMRTERFNIAEAAFSRCVQLENNRVDAWANLGSIYLHRRAWQKGYSALQQAIKMDRKDWRIWSNFLVACINCKNYSRAIFVQHTLLDLYVQRGAGITGDDGGNGVDIQCLRVLVNEVIASVMEQRAAALKRKEEGEVPKPDESLNPEERDLIYGFEESELPTTMHFMDDELAPNDSDSLKSDDSKSDKLLPSIESDPRGEHLDIGGQPASAHFDATCKLVSRISQTVGRLPQIWSLLAMLEECRGRAPQALEARLRQVRALQSAGWEKDERQVATIATAAKLAILWHLKIGGKRELTNASMLIKTIIGRVDAADSCVGSEGRRQLEELKYMVEKAQEEEKKKEEEKKLSSASEATS